MSSALEQRIKRMEEAGIPMPVTQIPISEGMQSVNSVPAQNSSKLAMLQAIKSGKNKQQIQSLVKATTAGTQQGFQGIPEPKMKKNPNNPNNQLTKEAPQVQGNFGATAPVSSEFSAMEAMYGGGSGNAGYNTQQSVMNTQSHVMDTTQPELSVPQDVGVPQFDPQRMLAKKRMQQDSEYMKFAVNPEGGAQAMNPEQQNFNFQYMQQMMEEIAKNTISDVLNSYTDKNKGKLTYENVNVKTSDGTQVIKTPDGKYYKLVPVKIKKA